MNGSTTVSPIFRANLCQCMHDYVEHGQTGTFTGSGTPTTGQTITVNINGVAVVTNQTTGQTLGQLATAIVNNVNASSLVLGPNPVIFPMVAPSLTFTATQFAPPGMLYFGSSTGGATITPAAPTTATGTCNSCLPGGIAHNHPFTGIWESDPSNAPFQTDWSYGYPTSGQLGIYNPNAGIVSVLGTVGSTTLTLNVNPVVQGGVVGGTIKFFNAAEQNSEEYEIIRMSGTTVTIPSPGLLQQVPNGTPFALYGRRGSMMGPGLPCNYQRAG